MIVIKKNPNFSSWFQVFAFGKMIDEIGNQAKAVSLANSLARNHKQSHIVIEGEAVRTKS
jgi:hypothetical protein